MELSGNVNNLTDEGAIAYLHAQEAIRRARARRRWIAAVATVGALFVLMVGCGIAAGAAASGGSTAHANGATSAPAPSLAPVAPVALPEPPATVSAPVTPSSDSSKSGIYGPGTYVVGRDIPPGDYWTPGSTTGHSGYASRMSGTSGNFDETLGVVSVPEHGPAQVTILTSDKAVEFYGDDIAWTKVS